MAKGRPGIDRSFAPSLEPSARPTVAVATSAPASATAFGVPVARGGPVPSTLGIERARLEAAGFDGGVGSALVVPPTDGPVLVAFGIGEPADPDAAALRDAAAAFARAAASHERVAVALADLDGVAPEAAAQAVVEGVLLARYRYDVLRREPKGKALRGLTLVVGADRQDAAGRGAERGRVFAAAQMLARDPANTPHSHLDASRLADIAVALGTEKGFRVEVFDKDALVELGCGGILGVNAGSAEPPRMVKLTVGPAQGATGRLALVGKGVTYDSGGLSLKPSDPVHAQMKNDMSGAAAVLAAVAALAELGGATRVTGYLMCIDNMPSGTATALGDVLTIRGGTTVEVMDTDAEGRLVMADALVLAAEERNDAIVDIATLTGSCLRALGPDVAGVVGNRQGLVEQVEVAADATGEPVWQLPLHRPYRRMLDSGVADLMNCAPVGKPDAILASLFLAEFVGGVPWAHLDICGPAQTNEDRTWHPAGCSGFGARLLVELASGFEPPSAS
jgi:leucyl aminopeptidase